MIGMRPFLESDIPELQAAIDKDTFHPGEWKVEHFYNPEPAEDKYQAPVSSHVIQDDKGPIAFVRFTKTLRISVVWNDGTDNSRNARAVILGIREAVIKARASGFSEIIITTNHPRLSMFLEKVIKMTKSGDEFLLAV
jgi:hypothetical protein